MADRQRRQHRRHGWRVCADVGREHDDGIMEINGILAAEAVGSVQLKGHDKEDSVVKNPSVRARTLAPANKSSGAVNSFSLWLNPSVDGTKIIALGTKQETATAS